MIFLRVFLLVTLAGFAVSVSQASAQTMSQGEIVTESYTIPSGDAGVDLYIRSKRLRSLAVFNRDNVVLFTHGSPEPAENSIDLNVAGISWMDYLASRGFDVYLVDMRGHGGSTRPAEMSRPASENPPLLSSATVAKDFATAVDHVLKRRGLDGLNLMAWSRGCITIASYAEAHPEKVVRLAMIGPAYAPLQGSTGAAPAAGSETAPAYSSFDRRTAMERWMSGTPEAKRKGFVPDAWIEEWWRASMERDWQGALQDPPVYRGPNGWYQFASEYQRSGKAFFYDAAKIKASTLIMVGEWDRVNPSSGSQVLFNALSSAPQKRFIQVGEGTHYMHREKVGRLVIQEVANFLSERQ